MKVFLITLAVVVVIILGWKMMSPGKEQAPKRQAKVAVTDTITIDGSNTMVHLVTAWSQAYMKENPGIKIIVTGNGSGTGISSLIQGDIGICAASRPMKAEEIADAKKNGITPEKYAVAKDAISIIVNPQNKVKVLTMAQLKQLFTGAANDWKSLGGDANKVEILSRETSSGTYEYFLEHVLNKDDFAKSTRMMPATSSVITTVAADRGAIGYVGLGYAIEAAGKVSTVAIKKDAVSPAIEPTEASVLDGSYPISRDLYFYTAGEPVGAEKKFLDFCLSPEGQQLVEKVGFVALSVNK